MIKSEEEEVFNQMITGAIVFKTTFRKYLEFIDRSGAEVDILYQKKTFSPTKKLIITEVNGQ
jgi:hypothetical protein